MRKKERKGKKKHASAEKVQIHPVQKKLGQPLFFSIPVPTGFLIIVKSYIKKEINIKESIEARGSVMALQLYKKEKGSRAIDTEKKNNAKAEEKVIKQERGKEIKKKRYI